LLKTPAKHCITKGIAGQSRGCLPVAGVGTAAVASARAIKVQFRVCALKIRFTLERLMPWRLASDSFVAPA
jgi:hypothetical protein